MKINKIIIILIFFFQSNALTKENIMILKLKDGDVEIQLFPDVAPKHVERIQKLANDGLYDNVVFHRVLMVLWHRQVMLSLEIPQVKILI